MKNLRQCDGRTAAGQADSGFSYSPVFFENLVDLALAHAKKLGATDAGADASEFTLTDRAENIAWRLIGLVCGLDGIYILNMPEVDDAAFNKHLDKLITLELF